MWLCDSFSGGGLILQTLFVLSTLSDNFIWFHLVRNFHTQKKMWSKYYSFFGYNLEHFWSLGHMWRIFITWLLLWLIVSKVWYWVAKFNNLLQLIFQGCCLGRNFTALLWGGAFGRLTVLAGVYSNTNWSPFTGGQNSILNWVLKLSLLNQKIKK